MKLYELLKEMGDDNIQMQDLGGSMTGFTANKKGEARLTFLTERKMANELATGKAVGYIVWMPTDKYQETYSKLTK